MANSPPPSQKARRKPTLIPSGPLWLGLGGLVPFYGAGLAMFAPDGEIARLAFAAFALYAASILSFLGGVRWGLEMVRAPDAPSAARLAYSVLPALAGWALAFVVIDQPALRGAAGIFAGLFAAQYAWDKTSAADAGAPAWYPALREVLTGGVMLACLLVIIARSTGRI